jgi:ABC-type dipeptide/oligopeptide/nickel transport system ATPase subunit
MNPAKKMQIVFQEKISSVNTINTVLGVITDITEESLTLKLQNNRYMIISAQSLLEINESQNYDLID